MLPLAEIQTIPQGVDYIRILPEIVLSIFGMLIMVLDPLVDERRARRLLGCIALDRLAGRRLLPRSIMAQVPRPGFWSMVRVDGFSIFFHFLIIAIAAVVILSFVRIHGSAADPGGRILRADPVRRGRHVPDVLGG